MNFSELLLSQQTFVLVKTYRRRLEDVSSVTFFCLLRRLEDIIARRLEDVMEDEKCYAEDVLRRLEDVFENKKCLRRLRKQEMGCDS